MKAAIVIAALCAAPAAAQFGEGMPTEDQFGNTFNDVRQTTRRTGDRDRTVVIRVEGAEVASQGAVLRGLDRIRGRTLDIPIAPGETVEYERLLITLNECRYPPGEQAAEAFAYLKIRDIRADETAFEGWMFASSPALSALDHPRYDVWVLSCKT